MSKNKVEYKIKVKVYNDEGIVVAENIEQILELLELNNYVVEVK